MSPHQTAERVFQCQIYTLVFFSRTSCFYRKAEADGILHLRRFVFTDDGYQSFGPPTPFPEPNYGRPTGIPTWSAVAANSVTSHFLVECMPLPRAWQEPQQDEDPGCFPSILKSWDTVLSMVLSPVNRSYLRTSFHLLGVTDSLPLG